MGRPDFENITSGAEFNTWYWLKEEMVAICKAAGLPTNGRKFELRDRIMFALDNRGRLKPRVKIKKKSTFNWAKATLTLETVITDNISFGPNFRAFMKRQIGDKFSCHSDFMDWAKANTGKTLAQAVEQWYALEARKEDPEFRRDIADNNMFNQYTRDFLNTYPHKTIKEARKYWLLKKKLPMINGFVRFEKTDIDLA
ncbi:MAG: DUF6434 domain-containing protein [Bacteroidota bacterium]